MAQLPLLQCPFCSGFRHSFEPTVLDLCSNGEGPPECRCDRGAPNKEAVLGRPDVGKDGGGYWSLPRTLNKFINKVKVANKRGPGQPKKIASMAYSRLKKNLDVLLQKGSGHKEVTVAMLKAKAGVTAQNLCLLWFSPWTLDGPSMDTRWTLRWTLRWTPQICNISLHMHLLKNYSR